MTPAYMLNGNSVVLVKDGKQYVASKESHGNYDEIIDRIKANDFTDIELLFDIRKAVVSYTNGLVQIVDEEIVFNGTVIHGVLAERILDMHMQGFNIDPMAKFLHNLMQNPSRVAVQELYLFMETGKLPLTEDGHFLAYKKVGPDYKDLYTGKMDNSVGQTLEIARNAVDDDRNNTCSYGLHFCSIDYLDHYGTRDSNKVVIVKINPADVVAIPSDYNNTKGRTCKYTVVGEYKDYQPRKEMFNTPVFTNRDFSEHDFHDIYDDYDLSSDEEYCTECGIDLEAGEENFCEDCAYTNEGTEDSCLCGHFDSCQCDTTDTPSTDYETVVMITPTVTPYVPVTEAPVATKEGKYGAFTVSELQEKMHSLTIIRGNTQNQYLKDQIDVEIKEISNEIVRKVTV